MVFFSTDSTTLKCYQSRWIFFIQHFYSQNNKSKLNSCSENWKKNHKLSSPCHPIFSSKVHLNSARNALNCSLIKCEFQLGNLYENALDSVQREIANEKSLDQMFLWSSSSNHESNLELCKGKSERVSFRPMFPRVPLYYKAERLPSCDKRFKRCVIHAPKAARLTVLEATVACVPRIKLIVL